MKSLYEIVICLAILMFPLYVNAGGGIAGHSSLQNYFLSYASGGNISFDTTEKTKYLHKLCDRKTTVYAFKDNGTYRCNKMHVGKFESGEEYWDQVRIEITGEGSSDRAGGGDRPSVRGEKIKLFSLHPFKKTKWETRSPTEEEIKEIKGLLQSSKGRVGRLRNLKIEKGLVIYKSNGIYKTLVVPGRVVKNEEAFYEAHQHHVFVINGNRFQYQGMLPDVPREYIDLNGDDLPEIITDEHCDGVCIVLWDIKATPKALIQFGGH